MTDPATQIVNIFPQKWAPIITLFIMVVLPWLGKTIMALQHGQGLVGSLKAIFYGSTTIHNDVTAAGSPAGNSKQSGHMALNALFALMIVSVLGVMATLMVGCARLAPGADPIIVRAEQTESSLDNTIDTFLKIDNADRGFFRTNVPAMHAFAEDLRKPVTPVGSGTAVPTWVAGIQSLDTIKKSYKSGISSSNVLNAAILTAEQTLIQAQSWIQFAQTNLPNSAITK